MRNLAVLFGVVAAAVIVYRATRPRTTASFGYYDATSPRHLDGEFVLLIEDGYLVEGW